MRGLEHLVDYQEGKRLEVETRKQPPAREASSDVRVTRQKQAQRYISFSVARVINPDVPEFADLTRYQTALMRANDAGGLSREMRTYKLDGTETTVAHPRAIHFTQLYATDAHDLLTSVYPNDKGIFRDPRKVRNNVKRIIGKHNEWTRQRNDRLLAHDTSWLDEPAGTIDSDQGDSALTTIQAMGSSAMLGVYGGVLGIRDRLQPFGSGNQFGYVPDDPTRAFLQTEREETLSFITSKLKPSGSIDPEITDRILANKHHATAIIKGIWGESPRKIIYPVDVMGERLAPPPKLVVGFDAIMKYIGNDDKRAT